MINQITNSSNSNIFAPFENRIGVNYAVTKPYSQTTESIEEKNNTKTHKLGVSIAIGSLIAGFGMLALMKGLPRNAYEKFNQLFIKLDEKIAKKEKGNLNIFQKLYLQTLKAAKLTTGLVKSSYNLGPLKDILIKKGLALVPFGTKFGDWITNVFEKISVKTLTKHYLKTSGIFEHLFAKLAKVNEKISPEKLQKPITQKIDGQLVTKTAQEWLEYFKKEIYSAKNAEFSEEAVNRRLKTVSENLKPLDEKVWKNTFLDIVGFAKSKNTYQTFIAEEFASPAKMELGKKVNEARQAISHDIQDNCNAAKHLLEDIYAFVDPSDIKVRGYVNAVKEHIKNYSALSGPTENTQRENITNLLVGDLDKLTAYIKGEKKYNLVSKQAEEAISQVEKMLVNSKKGNVQELLTIYKEILPREDYLAVKKEIYKAVNSFNKSTDMETDLLFDKLRDLKIGSAPSDVLSILASLGVVGWGLGKAENKDERTSVALKYGIPVVGSVATTLYCTARLVSGGKSILLGILSGIAIGKIGEMVDNARKKYNQKKIDLNNFKLPEIKFPLISDK